MIFVDTWAWVALASQDDQYHDLAVNEHAHLQTARRRYYLTDHVLAEVITQLYRKQRPAHAEKFIQSLFQAIDAGKYRFIEVSTDQFRRAWQMRRKYSDKPDISFVDLTSMIVMKDLRITEVFTGDAHFGQVGLGFRLVPSSRGIIQ